MRLTQEERRALRITLDYTNMTEKALGCRGIPHKELLARKKSAANAHARFRENRGKDECFLGWTELPYNQGETVKEILSTARKIRKNFDNFVVLGIGGSALGPLAAANALCHLHHNELPKSKRKAPRFYVEDNVDPVRMSDLLDVLDLKKTCFNVVSKSGTTSETAAQLLVVSDALERAGESLKDHFVFTTDRKKGGLVRLAQTFGGVKCFAIPDGVGGRFSELSPVGLLPAAVLGIDIKMLLQGASYMDKLCKDGDLFRNPALMSAVLLTLCMEKGKNISVLMPYSDNLRFIADWYAQLWAESLGKNKTLDGTSCNAGQTPVKALGATDQHSQLQLYTEGPFDKVVTFLTVGNYQKDVPIPRRKTGVPDVDFLCGHSLGELITAENRATAYALSKAGRLNDTIYLPQINPFTLGQLFYFFELQTAYAGFLINVNAYDQPGVEAGKQATFALLGKKGYETLSGELATAGSDPACVI